MRITLPTVDHAAASREARFEALCRRIDPGDGFGRAMERLQARINADVDRRGPVLAEPGAPEAMDTFDPEHVQHTRLGDARDVLEGRVEENTLVEDRDPAEQYQAHLDQTFQGRDGFVVDIDSRADWALRKLAEARRRVRERQAFVEIEVARLLAWQAKLDAEDVGTIHYMEQLLAGYFEQLESEGRLGRKKSYRLPHGQLAARQVPVRWEVDEAQLLAWAKPLGLVRIEKAPAWKAIKARLIPAAPLPGAAAIDITTGEIVPGVTLKDPTVELFHVRTEDGTNYGCDL